VDRLAADRGIDPIKIPGILLPDEDLDELANLAGLIAEAEFHAWPLPFEPIDQFTHGPARQLNGTRTAAPLFELVWKDHGRGLYLEQFDHLNIFVTESIA
jgi:hypothetical protein